MARRGIFQDQFESDMKRVLADALAPYDKPIPTSSSNARQTLVIEKGADDKPAKRIVTATSGKVERNRTRQRRGALKNTIRDVAFTIIAMVAAFLIINYLIVPNWSVFTEWFSHLFG